MLERSFHEAVVQLSQVSCQDGPSTVLDAIGRCVPVLGGTVGTLLVRGSTQSLTSHSVHLPTDMFESWMSTPQPNLRRMMAPMVRGPIGGLFTERREITGRLREELEVVRAVREAGFGETAGYKVGARRTASGAREIAFMTLALQGGATFGPEHHEVLAALHPSIEAALRRLAVPLLPSQSILAQILEDLTIGYACISDSGRVIEANERAYVLALRFAHAARLAAGRNAMNELVARLRGSKTLGRPVTLDGGAGHAPLEVSAHRLAKEVHVIPEDLTLLVIREAATTVPSAGLPLDGLTERQVEIAGLLASTELQYKEIADKVGITDGTMRTHAENIYRRLGVRSRKELMLRWKKSGAS